MVKTKILETTDGKRIACFFTKHCALSNHFPCNILVNGFTFGSSEQYFMFIKARTFGDKISAKKILQTSDPCDRIPNVFAMDNGTMVESFKFLNYYQLAKNSLVSKRFWNLIRTHRHKLALLNVAKISMDSYVANQSPAYIEMFNKKLSSEEYNKWIVRNGYSKHIPLEGQTAPKKESSENYRNIYMFSAKTFQSMTIFKH
ncbi:hypothetical protein DdX_21981 [Ditylenchus destructor]|uniref:Uncharacterized protein n=1 Tax=Ditylenchus destructor TaxID=166010 RepID=A0AAD4MF02_9BILA|nr:hypothetical protein DdX_21981 [Ditylenchus destructor]